MLRIDFGAGALDDLGRIWTYGSQSHGATAADGLISRMFATLRETIATFPESGRRRFEFGADVRSFAVLPYIVFYRVAETHIEVLRVLHAARDLKGPLISLLLSA